MIKRTLYFGNSAYLHTKDEHLVADFTDKTKAQAKVAIEDIGVVILDAHQLTISQNLMTKLLHHNVALISCDEKHMPQGLFLNLEGNTVQQERFSAQIEASIPLKKQLWQQTVKAKIHNQAAFLKKLCKLGTLELPEYPFENMDYWEENVKSGDTDNYEGRAAAFYWKSVFSDFLSEFKRGRFEIDPNNLLNYGYAILRATVARSLTAAGLLPTFGIHHHNKYNAYALADDIMEPYRPFVDEIVRNVVENHFTEKWTETGIELTPEIKSEILAIPAIDVNIDGEKSPLMIATQRTCSSLCQCFEGEIRKILYPVFGI
ncbi:MAG: type II CRISPR-associated endonuclease Cas1 [Bacteroidales bacterium]